MRKSRRFYKKIFVAQQEQSDCGVAFLSMLIKYFGGAMAHEQLRYLSGTDAEGTSLLGLYQAMLTLGFEAEGYELGVEDLRHLDSPAILHTISENGFQHYVVCLELNTEYALVADPAQGILKMPLKQLDKKWVSKQCLVVKPSEDFQPTKQASFSTVKLLYTLLKEDTNLIFTTIFLGLLVALLSMSMTIFSQILIDDILPNKNSQKLVAGIILVSFLLFVKSGLEVLRSLFLVRQNKSFNLRMIDFFFDRLLFMPLKFFDTRQIGDLTTRLHDTGRIQRFLSTLFAGFLTDILIVIVAFTLIYLYSSVLAMGILVGMIAYFFVIYSFNQSIVKHQKDVMQNYSIVEGNFIDSFQGISAIKNHQKEPFFFQKNHILYEQFQTQIQRLGILNIRINTISELIGLVLILSILVFVAYQIFEASLKIGVMVAILGLSSVLIGSVHKLALLAIPLNEAKVAFNRLKSIVLAFEPSESQASQSIKEFQKLSLQNIFFHFQGSSWLFEDISFSVEKGEVLGILGESGSGKSTLTKLIQKHYSPQKGDILVNNSYKLQDINISNWLSFIATVPQDIHIFNTNIKQNICLDDSINDNEFSFFLRNIGFEDYMSNFPQGIYTIIGEEGINLSGGQKQVIAILRALHKKPTLLILDEATSAMDKDTEQKIIDLLTRQKKEMAMIFISHRVEIVERFCDKVFRIIR